MWDVRQTGCNINVSPLLLLLSVLEADKRNTAFPWISLAREKLKAT